MRRVGKYRIQQKLGEGGMGVVYKAFDREAECDVALKLLHPHLRMDEERKGRFVREAKVLKRLDHPGIAGLLDHGEVMLPEGGATLFMAMEFVPGRDLQQRSIHGFEQREVVDIGIQLAAALAAAHAAGVIHRDLKPSNIKVSSSGEVKILDFGLAKPVTRTPEEVDQTPIFESRFGVVLGSAGYSAPEQLQGSAADQRADLFSLGAVLYQMLTDRVPFEVGPDGLPLDTRRPRAIGEIVGGVVPALERLVMKLLERDKEQRYESAEEVLAELRRIRDAYADALKGAVTPSDGMSAEAAATKDTSARRREGPWWAVALAVVVFLIVLVGYLLVRMT